MKKIFSLFLAIVMSISVMSAGVTAFAESINTAQTAVVVGIGTVAQTFRYGYPTGKGSKCLYENSIYYKFVAPTTDYYEFSVTGYENTVYAPGKQSYASVSISNSVGKYVTSFGTNEVTYLTKKAVMLTAGETYTLELYDQMSNIASYSSNNYGYAEQTIYLTIGAHTHDFSTEVYNYPDGSYRTSYDCNFCDYYTTVTTPAPKSNQQATVYSHDSNGYTNENYYKPTKTKITKLTAKKKSLTVKWAKASYVSGYQIQIATDKKFKKNKKTVTVSKANSTSKSISKLKANKKYYVRVRTYVTVNGKKQYSSWSSVKSVKTK